MGKTMGMIAELVMDSARDLGITNPTVLVCLGVVTAIIFLLLFFYWLRHYMD